MIDIAYYFAILDDNEMKIGRDKMADEVDEDKEKQKKKTKEELKQEWNKAKEELGMEN